ncbi:cupin domain-containing protein [Hansschlegelia zhihuaiae]|uniref:Cupin domain-containing protein n=1 Tax=Hansschlegelia zhihuaiae TaxID=405005 RepID=A0A4Q0MJX8_9HYPH|nr:cupin domain-containing protein [Hansschlegelia zhihuaiae]RXF73775.1 cupin domain-containing protein [Hansschlegelia zhihuaiae]
MSAIEALSAADVIALLGLQPHPEGGHFLETFRDPATDADGRSRSTGIYFLLAAGEVSAWHRVDAVEVWHFYAGGPLALTLSADGHDAETHRLGLNLSAGERPQLVVPENWWQAAESLGAWTLVGCTVAPAFEFSGFEMAPPDWRPTPRPSGAG